MLCGDAVEACALLPECDECQYLIESPREFESGDTVFCVDSVISSLTIGIEASISDRVPRSAGSLRGDGSIRGVCSCCRVGRFVGEVKGDCGVGVEGFEGMSASSLSKFRRPDGVDSRGRLEGEGFCFSSVRNAVEAEVV